MNEHSKKLSAPVACIIFNRPEKTQRVFEEIRRARPSKLFIIADGPRSPTEEPRCAATRSIVETIDWECEVFRNYSDVNLGCKMRVSSGISWVFEHVDRAIFLEDDCLPHRDFFRFCDELLERYEHETRIMHISGDNFQQRNSDFVCEESYYFSLIPHVWGWATWRRAWDHYDRDISKWPQIRESGILQEVFTDRAVRERWELTFDRYYRKTVDSWDGQWVCACLVHHGLSINPRVNLITNIGFDAEATHAFDPEDLQAHIASEPIEFPLTHPRIIATNAQADAFTQKYIFNVNRYFSQQVRSFFRLRFNKAYMLVKRAFAKT